MNTFQTGFWSSLRDASPGKAFLYLLFLIAIGLSLASALNLLVFMFFFGLGQADISSMLANPTSGQNMKALMISQLVTSIGVFIIPAWVFNKMRFQTVLKEGKSQSFVFWAALLSIGVIIIQAPLINYTAQLNEALDLTFISDALQQWMQQSEQDAKLITEAFLSMHSFGDLLFALLVMAVIPAIGEELLFRAGILRLLQQSGAGKHLAVWLTAFLFSFIHFQFFGFLPRFLLGALLGYLFTEGGSVIYPILAHFANNALAVVSAWPAFAGIESPNWFNTLPAAFISAVLAIAGVFLLRRMNMKLSGSDKDLFTVQ